MTCTGNDLYIKKGGWVCKIETDGKRLLFEPVKGKVIAKHMVNLVTDHRLLEDGR